MNKLTTITEIIKNTFEGGLMKTQYKRSDDSIAELVKFDNFKGFSEELGKETDYGVQIIDDCGNLLKICDLDGESISYSGMSWELALEAPDDVIEAFGSWDEGIRFLKQITREDFLKYAGSLSHAVDFENSILSVSNEFLPECAQAVKRESHYGDGFVNGVFDEGFEPAPEYWQFLISQHVQMLSNNEADPAEVF